MTMGTGGTSGTYYGYGGVLGQYIKNNAGIGVTVVSTDGSKANIQGMDAGNYQLGTVQSDVMAYAWEGTRSFEEEGKIDSFRTVAGLYAETVQLVTMDPAIKSVKDLKGKTVFEESGIKTNTYVLKKELTHKQQYKLFVYYFNEQGKDLGLMGGIYEDGLSVTYYKKPANANKYYFDGGIFTRTAFR